MIRKFIREDEEFLREKNMLAFLEISYCGSVLKDDVFTCTDGENTEGVLYFKKHLTFDAENVDFNRLCPEIITENEAVYDKLLKYAGEWLIAHVGDFKGKNVGFAIWEDGGDSDSLRKLLKNGYMEYSVCPCLKRNLTGEVEALPVPDGMTVEELTFDSDSVNAFIAATGAANNGLCDSADELMFLSGDESCKVFVLKDGDKIVSGAEIWRITDERAACENIFTVPEYRRKGMAQVIITHALAELKKRGYGCATLSMRGKNYRAARLYMALGFEFFFNQIELILPQSYADYK